MVSLSDMRIRYAEREDVSRLETLLSDLETELESVQHKPRFLRKEIKYFMQKGHYRVCEVDGKIVGAALLYMPHPLLQKLRGGSDTDKGEIYNVITDMEYRGKGIGTALINDLVDLAVKNGCKSLLLMCNKHNVPFYSRFSFRVIREVDPEYVRSKLHYSKPIRQYIMSLDLSSPAE